MTGYTISAEVENSLRMVIEYVRPDEALDYERCSLQDRDRHIYKHVMVVERWLSELSKADKIVRDY